MRVLVQRVNAACVTVDSEEVGRIGCGLVLFVGISKEDGEREASRIVNKVVNLRIFSDQQGKFNLSALDIQAEILLISQFTLYSDTRKGRRPSFLEAAAPQAAKILFEKTAFLFRETGLAIATGRFQSHMLVSIENDGPVTIMLDSIDDKRD